MYQDRICLKENDILDKEFKIDTKGYRPQEVDKFLDTVIKDYAEFKKIIKDIDSDNKKLLEENLELRQEIRALKTRLEIVQDNGSDNSNNSDVLRRLSNLEKLIYGKEN